MVPGIHTEPQQGAQLQEIWKGPLPWCLVARVHLCPTEDGGGTVEEGGKQGVGSSVLQGHGAAQPGK